MPEKDVLPFLREYWIVIAGITTTLWYLLVRWKRSVLMNYATVDQMAECRIGIITKLESQRQENIEQHNRIADKVDDLKTIVIENMRAGK